jgi:hypothetical protein
MTDSEQLLTSLKSGFADHSFVKLTLGKFRGKEPDLRRVLVKPVTVKKERCLSFVYSYVTKDVTKNLPIDAAVDKIGELVGRSFKSAHLFLLTGNLQVEYNKKGESVMRRGGPTSTTAPIETHNRDKKRFVDPGRQFLGALGITNEEHAVLPSMSRKWKQINKFVEVFDRAFTSSHLSGSERVRLVDFGSGKGYLTFAVHDYLETSLGVEADVTGIEIRKDLVDLCNGVSDALGTAGLRFRQGDISDYDPKATDVMIALHACDVATDLAIHMGIRSGAQIVMCAPCCHKQIRPQIKLPVVLQPMLQFGVHLGQEAEMVTDALRAMLLELNGYRAQIFEFISMEHTSKNKMLLAVKHGGAVDRPHIEAKIHAMKEFYGIKEHYLETLLQ